MPARSAIVLGLYSAFAERLGACDRPPRSPLVAALGAILGRSANPRGADGAISALESAGFLSLQALREVSDARLAELIRPAGALRVKLPRLRHFLDFLKQEGVEDIADLRNRDPFDLREALLSVRGIGLSTADAILCEALHVPAFVVGTSSVRIFARHGLISPEECDYGEIQELVRAALPRDAAAYSAFHDLLGRAAKEWCAKTGPRCRECPARGLLPDPERFPQ